MTSAYEVGCVHEWVQFPQQSLFMYKADLMTLRKTRKSEKR